MSEAFSANTKAILLLTAPLIAGRNKPSPDLLSPAEYQQLALRLREMGRQPSDLLAHSDSRFWTDLAPVVVEDRLKRLLERGFLLSQAVERWHTRAIWVTSRADTHYPQILKHRLKDGAPAVLYGCGIQEILNKGGLAVVGSRNATATLIEYTTRVARLTASSGLTVVSGGARGVDQAAMRGALDAGGSVVGVLADSLESAALNREHRRFLQDGKLLLISPNDPTAGFNVGRAMQRNKLIYALADAALVVDAQRNRGGTWAGAAEQLTRLRLVPIYVRSTDDVSSGLEALIDMGARRWPDPDDREALITLLSPAPSPATVPVVSEAKALPFVAQPDAAPREIPEALPSGIGLATIPANLLPELPFNAADELFRTVRALILRVVRNAMSAEDVARALAVTKKQADEWLKRLMADGVVKKRGRPARYSIREASLFDTASEEPRGRTTRDRSRGVG